MMRNEVLENIVSAIYLILFSVAMWKPEWQWAGWVGTAIFLAGIGFSLATSSTADRERRRKAAWIAPVIMVVMAAQLAYGAAPEYRTRTLLLGAGLVLSGLALFWARRRAT